MDDLNIIEFSSAVKLSFGSGSLINIVFSSPKNKDITKVKGSLKDISGKTFLQLEYFLSEGRVRQENIDSSQIEEKISRLSDYFSHIDLNDCGGQASLLISKKGKVSLVSHGKIGEGTTQLKENNKGKRYILKGDEPFLYFLDISDKNGRVHDKKQSKFRQINRFTEYAADYVKYLPEKGTVYIADLCCGKSYLSFAVYYYFSNILKRDVVMECTDLKKSVMEECSAIAEKCGFDNMSFIAGDVTEYAPSHKVDMVISLHACDTATDIVLEKAVALSCDVILATPCCHRELSRNIKCEALSFAAVNPVLKYKMCDALTDSLRILMLKANGYVADATELIDPEETPKNILIRARKNRGMDLYKRKKYLSEYNKAKEFLGL